MIMRLLKRNCTTFWYVSPLSFSDFVDEFGYETGESVPTFSEPNTISLSTYPANSEISERIFGVSCELDKIALDTKNLLSPQSLIFLKPPTIPYEDNYDYKVSKSSESINHSLYGLKRRIG